MLRFFIIREKQSNLRTRDNYKCCGRFVINECSSTFIQAKSNAIIFHSNEREHHLLCVLTVATCDKIK